MAWLPILARSLKRLTAVRSRCGSYNTPTTSRSSAWATHYRQHYCRDEDLPDLVADMGLNAEFLTNIKFPDATLAPGPSTRAGDFGEI